MNILGKSTPFENAHVNVQEGLQRALPSQSKTTQQDKPSQPADKLVPPDKVAISSEAKAKIAEESSDVQSQNAMRDIATKGQEATAAEESSEIEKMIEEFEE